LVYNLPGYKQYKYKEKENVMALRVGQPAPDFTLPSHLEKPVQLSDYLGKKNIVLAFFPLAWTPV
jgi:peroxiredoxin